MSGLTTREVLLKAADLLEPEGAWTRGAFSRNADGSTDNSEDDDNLADTPVCWCVLGAVAHVAGFNPNAPRAWLKPQGHALDAALKDVAGLQDIVSWNDAPERRQAEVVAALRAAAKRVPA